MSQDSMAMLYWLLRNLSQIFYFKGWNTELRKKPGPKTSTDLHNGKNQKVSIKVIETLIMKWIGHVVKT
jgi:hypothetical protein